MGAIIPRALEIPRMRAYHAVMSHLWTFVETESHHVIEAMGGAVCKPRSAAPAPRTRHENLFLTKHPVPSLSPEQQERLRSVIPMLAQHYAREMRRQFLLDTELFLRSDRREARSADVLGEHDNLDAQRQQLRDYRKIAEDPALVSLICLIDIGTTSAQRIIYGLLATLCSEEQMDNPNPLRSQALAMSFRRAMMHVFTDPAERQQYYDACALPFARAVKWSLRTCAYYFSQLMREHARGRNWYPIFPARSISRRQESSAQLAPPHTPVTTAPATVTFAADNAPSPTAPAPTKMSLPMPGSVSLPTWVWVPTVPMKLVGSTPEKK